MSATDELLRNAQAYADSFDNGDLPLPPVKRLAIVACMDARLDPYKVLGLREGDAHVIRNAGGVVTDDAIRSLAVNGNQAAFNGKANIQDITDPLNPISIDGNATLQVELTDNGEPGSSDTIGITLWNKSGGLWFASNWNGTKTVEQALGGGNLVIHYEPATEY